MRFSEMARRLLPCRYKAFDLWIDRIGGFDTEAKLKESKMNWDRIEGNWKAAKGAIKATWGKLTDNDIDIIDGDRERLEGKLQDLYGLDKEEVRKEVDKWAKEANWD